MRTGVDFRFPIGLALWVCLGLGWTAVAAAAMPESGLAAELRLPSASVWSVPSDLEARAADTAVLSGDTPQVKARLLVAHPAPNSGAPRQVGVLFDLAPGWHLYWRNPGETGIAPQLNLRSDGLAFGEVAWPSPQVFEEADGLFTTYGYEDQVLLSAEILAADSAASGSSGLLRAEPSVLVCRTECVPAQFTLETSLAPHPNPKTQTRIDSLFAENASRLPRRGTAFGAAAIARWSTANPAEDETAVLALRLPNCGEDAKACPFRFAAKQQALFLPFEDFPFELESARGSAEPNAPNAGAQLELTLTRLEAGAGPLRGLIPVRDAEGTLGYIEIEAPIAEGNQAAAAVGVPGIARPSANGPAAAATGSFEVSPADAIAHEAPSAGRWIQVLFLALLGGLILNGMPCVLPVLAIKVVAIADLGEKEAREVRIQGLAYTAGVLGSMALLGAAVLTLRAAGHSVGWGFQFQEPLFVAGISAVLVAFALNLFGVFEIDFGQGRLAAVGQTGSATKRSLFEGLLAVVLATPCTAPFLGTAVGFAFAAPGIGILAIFAMIGLGLALPFLVVSFVPAFARFIPRSGPWMMKLRSGLGFCLLATNVWLLWIVGQSGGTEAVIGMVAMLLLLSFLLWVFGQMQPLESAWTARASALLIAGVAIAGFNLVGLEAESGETRSASQENSAHEAWAVYSERAVAETLAAGRPAFVVFTADWCITCQVNEKRVIERPETLAAFKADNVALFKADWTRRDESIRVKLAEFGRAGVPLYLLYTPADPDQPIVLSELLGAAEIPAALATIRDGIPRAPRA